MNNPNIKSVVLGDHFSFILEKNGDLYASGKNKNFEIGLTNEKVSEFTKVTSNVKRVSASPNFSIIQKDDGTIWYSGKSLIATTKGFTFEIELSDIIHFSCGSDHAIFLNKSGGVYVLGSNDYGECGFDRNVTLVKTPRLLLTDQNIFGISYGNQSIFILTSENRKTLVKCSGRYLEGDLGRGNKMHRFELATIDSFPNIASIHSGNCHNFLLMDNGDVYACGFNEGGQCSLGETKEVSVFTKTTLKDIKYITTGSDHSIFLNKKKRSLRLWKSSLWCVGIWR
eukprot:TRINITY_DN7162_c0_g1_i1.p1 TRINITY_DN7162_c0_g1~~TRINITY_DN7162_c0_g1_i1.p1  ORF type:complete len:283 (-),score=58.23 TRINITY_DN7162_c0_g1_i1:519-1367(-)